MKKFTLMTLFAVAFTCSVSAGEKELPPGLQKKDKLPPGIAKRGIAEERVVVVTNTVVVPAAPAPAAPAAVATATRTPEASATTAPTLRQLRVDITKHARAINTLDNRAPARQAGLEAIAKETGVSVPTLQVQHRQHQEIGTAGLLMANVIAVQTKRPAGNYLRQAAEGKPWEHIAADNGVNLESLDAKLGQLEETMRSAR